MIVGLGAAAQLVTNNLGIETYMVYKLDIQVFFYLWTEQRFFKGIVPRDFRVKVFFMNQDSQKSMENLSDLNKYVCRIIFYQKITQWSTCRYMRCNLELYVLSFKLTETYRNHMKEIR